MLPWRALAHSFSPANNHHDSRCGAKAHTQKEGGQTGAVEVDDLESVVDIPDLGGFLIVSSLDAIIIAGTPAHDVRSQITGQIARHAAVDAY